MYLFVHVLYIVKSLYVVLNGWSTVLLSNPSIIAVCLFMLYDCKITGKNDCWFTVVTVTTGAVIEDVYTRQNK